MGDLAHLHAGAVPMALAGFLLSAVFVVAEVLSITKVLAPLGRLWLVGPPCGICPALV